MLTSLRKKYGRSSSVNEYDLEQNKMRDGPAKSRFTMLTRKVNGSRYPINTLSTQRAVNSEPTRRKFPSSGLQLKSKSRSGTFTDSSRSIENDDLRLRAKNRQAVDDPVVARPHSSDSIHSPGSLRRLAICTELEKCTLMENGESLLIGHKNLVIRDYLENYAYI